MNAEEYLSTLIQQIRCKKAHEGIRKELLIHIEEERAFLEGEGVDSAEAEKRAVEEMGDPIETGTELDRIHRPRMAWGMILLIGILSLAGYAVQYLIQIKSERADFMQWNSNGLLYIFLGFVVMIAICYCDYTRIGIRAKGLSIILFCALCLGMKFQGQTINARNAWISAGSFTLDIRLMLFLFIPLYGAILYSYRGQGYEALVKAAGWMLPILFLANIIPSLTTAIMLMLAYVMVLSTAVSQDWFRISRKKTLAGIGSVLLLIPLLGIGYIYLFGHSYQWERVISSVDIFQNKGDIQGSGYMLSAIKNALTDSRLIGSNNALIKGMIPENGDYVLTYIISYYGVLAAVVLVGVMAVLYLRLLNVTMRQKNQMGMIMGVGCASILLTMLVLYILSNTGVLFITTYCPFIGAGGTGAMVTYALLGLLLSIFRYQNIIPSPGGSDGYTIKLSQSKIT